MWRETRPIWTIIRYTSLAVIVLVGGALLWMYVTSTDAKPAENPTSPAVTLPTETWASRIIVPPTVWETPTPRPKKPTWTPLDNPTGTNTLLPTGTPTLTLVLTYTQTPTIKGTPSITRTPTRTTLRTPTPTYNPGKQNQTITFGPLTGKTYGDGDFAVSATASSGLAVSFSTDGSHCTNSGSTIHITGAGSCLVTASQDGDSSWNPAPPIFRTLSIAKANPVCSSVSGYTITYNTHSHTATGSCLGIFGEILSGLDLSSTTHTNASTYPSDPWVFTDITGNYNNSGGAVSSTINKADGCTITGWTGTFDDSDHGAIGSCLGIGSYDPGQSYRDYPGGDAVWSYTGDSNYNSEGGTVTITINPAASPCNIYGYSGTYDGSAHGASGSCQPSGTLNLGNTFTDALGGTANWSFTSSDPDYTNRSGSVSITINKVDAVCNISGWAGQADGSPHGASGSCTGASGTLDYGSTFTDPPGGTATWTFTPDDPINYNGQSGSVAIDISP